MKFDTETETTVVKGAHKRPTFLVVVPTFGLISIEYHIAAQRLMAPVNSSVQSMVIKGEEVGTAREIAINQYMALGSSRPEYLFFFGDDMIPEWHHLITLWEEMRKGQWDVLAALYYMKQDDVPTPILWRSEIPGILRPHEHYVPGEVVASDICGMDFTLISPRIIEKIEPPYFKTSFIGGDQIGKDSVNMHTEDAYFCRKVLDAGGKVGVHTGVRVAHLNVQTGELY